MLSYRHSFHAGNFGDVIKHIVLTELLRSLQKKEKAFDYIDTHAGAGLFDLRSEHAKKLAEHVDGIGRLQPEQWPELAGYFEAISACNRTNSLNYYPGSPLIATHLLRTQDRAWLFELHPSDYELLKKNIGNNRQVRIMQQDGLQGMLSLLPPVSRRGCVLIDPSYEVKAEFEQVYAATVKAHKKFSTGVYAIWYPVVDRKKIKQLESSFIGSGIRNIQRFEFGLYADALQRGLTSAGMIVVNPPWGLFEKMSQLLPKLVRTFTEENPDAFYKCDILVDE